MTPALEEMLVEAIRLYNYPAVTYDLLDERERWFPSMRDLESYLQTLLTAHDVKSVESGLAGVLYWGHYRAGYKSDRVRKFRSTVTDKHLRQAIMAFPALRGSGLMDLRNLRLPQFTYMAFLTKLRTFLDPGRYCVLDSKVASLMPLSARLKCKKTYIPVTVQNERAYD